MVTHLSELANLIQEDAVPFWLKVQLLQRKDELLREINARGGGVFTFKGPEGQELQIEIKAQEKKETVAAKH